MINEYLMLGDLHTAALVRNGSIDWLCLPRFDSASIFGRLLDENAGSFSIEGDYNITQKYSENTAIVETSFEKDGKKFVVKDFMVPQPRKNCPCHMLVRKVRGVKGRNRVTFVFDPKPDYGREQMREDFVLDNMRLDYPKDAKAQGKRIIIDVEEGEEKELLLVQGEYEKGDHENNTRDFWNEWVKKGSFFDFCKQKQIRSAITLKLMQYYPTGGIIASPTTSLPEETGGVRNWDYRYVWIRDATFILYGLYVMGYTEEAEKFFSFIESIAQKCEDKSVDFNLLYTVDGGIVPEEEELGHLRGYKNSRPVRVGNGAKEQFQLDIYGSLIDAYYFMSKKGLNIWGSKDIVAGLVNRIKQSWKNKDNGIWEVRGELQHFTYSKVMAWVGVNRAVKLCDIFGWKNETKEEWIRLEEEIKDWIWQNCYDKELGSFTQFPASGNQDATNFLFVLLHFLDKRDKETKKIIENTCKELAEGVFVYRYRGEDGLPGNEGAFILCSFWLISAYAILEDKRAMELFREMEKYLSVLISEEIDPKTGEYLGNYPQGFSHIGYIMSAYYIGKYKDRF